MPDSITIRKVLLSDLNALVAISRQTYAETFFEAFNDPAGFNIYVDEVFAIKQLATEIADQDSAFYFAIIKNAIAGYVKLNFKATQTVFQGYDAVEIERIYVLTAHQNKQIGKALLNQAITKAKGCGLTYIWLSVWEENIRAIQFYEKQGFLKFDTHYYILGNDRQTDFLLKRML